MSAAGGPGGGLRRKGRCGCTCAVHQCLWAAAAAAELPYPESAEPSSSAAVTLSKDCSLLLKR